MRLSPQDTARFSRFWFALLYMLPGKSCGLMIT